MMIGFEYICKLFGAQYKEIADELGISKQTINSWTSIRRKIPKKHISSLSKRFNIPEKYFQKEIDRRDELEIEKIKFKNGLKETKYEHVEVDDETGKEVSITRALIDIEDLIEVENVNYKIRREELLQKITDSLDECFKDTNEDEDNIGDGLSSANELLRFYENFFSLVKNPKVNKDTLREIMKAMDIHYTGRFSTDSLTNNFIKGTIDLIDKRDKK